MFFGLSVFGYLSYDFAYADPDLLSALDKEPEATQSLLGVRSMDDEEEEHEI